MTATQTNHGAAIPLPEKLPPKEFSLEEKDERVILDFDAAAPLLPDGDRIHTFLDGGILIGANWDREELLTAMRTASEIHVTGEYAQRMKHGLAIKHPKNDSMLFIETNGRTDELFV